MMFVLLSTNGAFTYFIQFDDWVTQLGPTIVLIVSAHSQGETLFHSLTSVRWIGWVGWCILFYSGSTYTIVLNHHNVLHTGPAAAVVAAVVATLSDQRLKRLHRQRVWQFPRHRHAAATPRRRRVAFNIRWPASSILRSHCRRWCPWPHKGLLLLIIRLPLVCGCARIVQRGIAQWSEVSLLPEPIYALLLRQLIAALVTEHAVIVGWEIHWKVAELG